MRPRTIGGLLRSPRLLTPLVVLATTLYPPTVGVGTEDAPDAIAQGVLVVVTLLAATVAVTDPRVRRLAFRPPVVFALLLSGWMAMSALQASEPLDGVARGVWFTAATTVAIWTVIVERWPTALLLFAAPFALIIIAGIAAYPVADVEFQGNEFFNERLFPWPRFRGLATNHTVIGLGGALLCSIAFSMTKAWGPTLSRAIAVAGLLGVLASHSRAAIGALAIGLLLEILRSRRDLLTPALALALIVSALWLFAGGAVSVLDRSNEQEGIESLAAEETGFLTGREDVWSEALDFASAQPLTGRGNGAFAAHTDQQFEDGVRNWDPHHAHNVALELLVDQGLIGVLNLVAMCLALVILRAHLQVGSLGILAIVGAHSLVEGLFYGAPRPEWLLVVAVLTGVALSDSGRDRAEAHDPPHPGQHHDAGGHRDHPEAHLRPAEGRR